MSTAVRRRTAGAELVPLAHRVRHMQLFRLGAVALSLALATFDSGGALPEGILGPTLAYGAVVAAAGLAWRQVRSRGLRLFGSMLLVDGVYLGWMASATGGTASPVRYVVLLHLIAVALLASHRTSLKLATWHTLVTLLLFHARDLGLVHAATPDGVHEHALQVFIVLCWLVTLVTASFSAVNERELRRRRYDLEALASFTGELEAAAEPKEVATALLQHLADEFDITRGVLVGARAGEPQVIAHLGCAFRPASAIGNAPGSVVARARRQRRTLLASGIDARDDAWLDELMPAARYLIVVPLPFKEPRSGVLICEHNLRAGSRIEQRVVTMIERFAAHAALALENSWLLDELTQAATTDGLTGLRNRRAFDDLFAKAVGRSARSGEPLSLLLLDIDHFKELNDTLGHQTGDDVLREVGTALNTSCRPFDVAARYGGEEFAVVLPGCSAADAHDLAERIRRAATSPVSVSVSGAPVTASAGAASYPEHGATPEALLAAADAALYQAKRSGRNRLVVADPQAGMAPAAPVGAA